LADRAWRGAAAECASREGKRVHLPPSGSGTRGDYCSAQRLSGARARGPAAWLNPRCVRGLASPEDKCSTPTPASRPWQSLRCLSPVLSLHLRLPPYVRSLRPLCPCEPPWLVNPCSSSAPCATEDCSTEQRAERHRAKRRLSLSLSCLPFVRCSPPGQESRY